MLLTAREQAFFDDRIVTAPGGGLIWTGKQTPKGYGQMRVAGELIYVYTVAWVTAGHELPEGYEVDHKCFNPPCVALSHLQAISIRENRRNRRTTRLTERDVAAIRESALTHRALSEHYGVSRPHISVIRSGKRWQAPGMVP